MRLAKAKTALVAALALTAVSLLIWQETRVRNLATRNRQLEAAAAVRAAPAELAPTNGPATSPRELDRLKSSEEALKLEVARLRGRLASVLREESRAEAARGLANAAAPAKSGTNPPAGLNAMMEGMMEGMVDQQFQGRLARMKSVLKLTPEQEQAIREIFKRQASQATRAAQKMLAGGLTAEDSAELQRETGDPTAQIKALLTPEQAASYKDYQRSENMANARLAANGEVLQMQTLFGLSTEQQDQAFAVLYDQTFELLENPAAAAAGTAGAATDSGAALDRMVDRKVQALEGVLTPEQSAAYRRLQEQQMAFMKKLMPPPRTNTAPAAP
jgi:hypothetical protein